MSPHIPNPCARSEHSVRGQTPFASPSVDTTQRALYRVNMTRARHPKKEVEAAISAAEEAGWTVNQTSSGHRWGVMLCGETSRSGCQISIWSTPRNPGNHANQIRRALDRCPHDWSHTKDT